jgi:predicted small secreted protein
MKKNINHLAALVCILVPLLTACDTVEGPADIQMLRESRPIGNAKELAVDLKYDVGQLEIMKTSDDNLFSFDLQYDRRRYEPRFSFNEDDHSSMRLEVESQRGFGSPHGRDNDLTLRLTDKVPLDLNLASGVSESRLELSGLKVRRMRLRGGVGKTEVTFEKPSGQVMNSLDVESGVGELIIHGLGNAQVEQIDLKGGVGHTELDFTGDLGTSRMDARIKVGVGAVRLTVPRDADVEIEAEGSFLSNISAPSFDRDGHIYRHHGDGGAKIRIQVQSGVGGVEVELI